MSNEDFRFFCIEAMKEFRDLHPQKLTLSPIDWGYHNPMRVRTLGELKQVMHYT